MAITDTPTLSMLRARLHWHQERQRLLAENVANADTPDYKPRDLAPPDFSKTLPRAAAIALARTDAAHIAGAAVSGGRSGLARQVHRDIRPAGNAVNLEEEMMKVASNAMDYQAAATLYSRSLGLIKMALSKK